MRFILPTTVLGLLAANINAVAISSPAAFVPNAISFVPQTDERAKFHIYNCFDPNFTGKCENMDAELGQCYNLDRGWGNQISSSGPDKDVMCVLYANANCSPGIHQINMNWPGYTDLRAYDMDDKANSFMCHGK